MFRTTACACGQRAYAAVRAAATGMAAARARTRNGAPPQTVMSFEVNLAQAAEPNTAAYSAWSPRFLTSSSQ